jgi:signal transduction histidine kinase
MLKAAGDFFDTSALSPHGICLLWKPELVWLHVISDAVIVLAYYSIPIALIYFVRRRADLEFGWVFWCFAVFITACGTTHLASIWTLWHPDYAAEGVVKAVTAAASIATAGALWPLLPVALRIPSPRQLKQMNATLHERVQERDAALERLSQEMAERERAEAMLRQAQKLEALGRLTAGVAHDFNNLLSVVTLNVERLRRDLPAEGRAARAADTSLEAARRAADLTAQMLSYVSQGASRSEMVDLAAFLRGSERLARDVAGPERHVTISAPDRPARVELDGAGLTSALLNLVANARDATPAGGRIVIDVARGDAEAGKSFWVLSVADDGQGMSPEVRARAFDPFYTTKAPGRGSGLGLSQVLGFARAAGGQATIRSSEGGGTRVSLALPEAGET